MGSEERKFWMMSPTQLDSSKPWTFAAQDLMLSASRIFFSSHFPLLFIFCRMKISQSSNHCTLFLSAWSFDQRGKLKHYFAYLWYLERCSSSWSGAWGSSIPPQPQVENESQELPFLSQLLSSNRIRSQCQQKQLQATQTNLLFFLSQKCH